MRSFALACSLLLLTSVLTVPSIAAEYIVAPDGSGLYPTIQDALDESSDGDIVTLLAGTFTGPGNRDLYVGTSVTIRSENSLAPSVIDCQGSAGDPHRGFLIQGDSSTLEYLIIRNGYADLGGAILANSGSSIVIDHCILADNVATGDGGAVYADGTDVSLTFCTVFHNEAVRGSAVFLVQGAVGRLDNSIVAFGLGGAACDEYYGGGFVAGCTDIYGNRGGDWIGSLAAQLGVNSNLAVDPGLRDPMGTPAFYNPDGSGALQFHPCDMGAVPLDWFPEAPVSTVLADGRGMYPTIQAALDGVPDKAIVELTPGIFTGPGNRDLELRGKNVTVRGRTGDPADVIIDVAASPADLHRAFYVHEGEGTGTAIEHLTIRNGVCDPQAGLPEGGTGGGILLTNYSSLTVNNCRFDNNVVMGSAIFFGATGEGAAIRADLSPDPASPDPHELWLVDCTFTDNVGREAVLVDYGDVGALNCTFTGNNGGLQARYLSGARISGNLFESFEHFGLQLVDITTAISVDTCEFRNSSGSKSAISINDCQDITFNQCTVDQVLATDIFAVGVVFISASNVAFNATDFKDSDGRIRSCVRSEYSTIQFNDCLFSGNSGGLGAALYAESTTVGLDRCLFTGNIASKRGGGAYFTASTVTCRDTDFTDNTAGLEGGGLYAEMCNLTVADCSFDANSDGLRHHGSSLQGISITGTTFSNHTTGWAAEIDSMLVRPVVIDQCVFRTGSQGLRLFAVPDFRLANTEFSDNPANRAVSIDNASGVIDTCSFDRNSAVSSGGALYMLGSDVGLRDCTFADNSSDIDGGAVQVQSGSATFDDCRFDRNHTVDNGGALAAVQATVVLSNCGFSENTADGTGGSLYTETAQTTLTACTIAGGDGGILGGGAYHRYGNTWYQGGLVAGNNAVNGGGIATSVATVEISDLQVVGNSAVAGGGLLAFNSDLTLNDSEIVANDAGRHGGMYLYQSTTAVVSGTLIAGNTASIAAGSGVTVIRDTDVTFLQSTIAGNSGPGSQAQIYGDENAVLALSATVVAFGGSGPAVAFEDSASTIQIETSDVFGNAAGDWTGPLAGLEGAAYNFSLDPLFCEADLRNYHLNGASPCVGGNNPSGLDVGAYGTGCGGVSDVAEEAELPRSFVLYGNSPNPFNPRTSISFDLPVESPVVLEIYDVSGRRVRRLVGGTAYPAGSHRVVWDGTGDEGQMQSSGVYLYRIAVAGHTSQGKMALLR